MYLQVLTGLGKKKIIIKKKQNICLKTGEHAMYKEFEELDLFILPERGLSCGLITMLNTLRVFVQQGRAQWETLLASWSQTSSHRSLTYVFACCQWATRGTGYQVVTSLVSCLLTQTGWLWEIHFSHHTVLSGRKWRSPMKCRRLDQTCRGSQLLHTVPHRLLWPPWLCTGVNYPPESCLLKQYGTKWCCSAGTGGGHRDRWPLQGDSSCFCRNSAESLLPLPLISCFYVRTKCSSYKWTQASWVSLPTKKVH